MYPFSTFPSTRFACHLRRTLGVVTTSVLLSSSALAQTPTITSSSPVRNTLAAPRAASVAVTFSQPLNPAMGTQQALRVFSSQAGGKKTGLTTVSGHTLTFNPATDFQAGETVSATVTTAAQSSGGQQLATGHVFQFTTATTPGSGLFSNPQDLAVTTQSLNYSSIATGDVDGDGDLDLLTANSNFSYSTVRVRLNTGGGRFSVISQEVRTGYRDYRYSQTITDITLADMDGDGDLDLLATNDLAGPGFEGLVSIRFNNGSGTFGGEQDVSVGEAPRMVTTGDVDGDGDVDLLTAIRSGVIVHLNDGTGGFIDVQRVNVSNWGQGLTLGDIDRDGDLDLLTLDASGQQSVNVRLNDGRGTFSPTGQQLIIANAAYPFRVALGDVDSDGDLDLATPSSLYLNDGNGNFSAGPQVGIGGTQLGDVDGDGDLDLLLVDAATSTVTVRRNTGRGLFANGQQLRVSMVPTDLVLGDVDGNGTLDLLTDNRTTVSIYLNQPTVSVAPVITTVSPTINVVGSSVVLTGFNLTGTTGITFNGVAALTFVANSTHQVTVTVPAGAMSGPVVLTTLDGPSNGVFFSVGAPPVIVSTSPTPNTHSAPRSTPVAVTFNQPLSEVSGITQSLKVFSQQAGGQKAGSATISGNTLTFTPTAAFQPGETVLATVTAPASGTRVFQFTTATAPSSGLFNGSTQVAVGTGPASTAVGDLDGDGDLDLLTGTGTGTVSVRFNNGTGLFTGNQEVAVSGIIKLLTADVDSDGDLDLLALGRTISVRLNNGTGTFSGGQEVNVTGDAADLAVGDVDGDGDLDLLTAYTAIRIGGLSVHLNNGDGTFVAGYSTSGSTVGIAFGDVDGDGDLDFVAAGYQGFLQIYHNNGQGTFSLGQTISLTNSTSFSYPNTVAIGDLDGDNDLDFVATRGDSPIATMGLNNGSGSFSTSQQTATVNLGALLLSDVDGDGDLDCLTATDMGALVWVNSGSASFNITRTVRLPAGSFSRNRISLGDVDGNGTVDLLAANTAGNTVNVRFNQAAPSIPVTYRYNAGGESLTTSRGPFAADQYFSPASATATTMAAIVGTSDLALYQTERYSTNGQLSYAVPVANGTYSVVLHFAETYWTRSGQRVFNINLEGTTMRRNFDIVAKVGPLTATTESFSVTVTDGVLNLDLVVPYLSGGRDQAKLSALEVLPITTASRFNAGGPALTTTRGTFADDQYFSGATATTTTMAAIAGTDDDALYQSERYSIGGVLSYGVPVANGIYRVVLHFAETYWTQAGQRVFNIALENTTVRTNFDIVAKVGPFTATTETFLIPVGDGVLNLELRVPYLSGGRDQAKLSAVEVLPEISGRGALATAPPTRTPLGNELRAYPNPVTNGRFTLAYTAAQAQTGMLTLVDHLGRTVHQQPVQLPAGLNQIAVHPAQVRAGLYQLVLRTTDGQFSTQKVVVQ